MPKITQQAELFVSHDDVARVLTDHFCGLTAHPFADLKVVRVVEQGAVFKLTLEVRNIAEENGK